MSGWGCPHNVNEVCMKLGQIPCDPGNKGCVLFGRYRMASPNKVKDHIPARKRREMEAKKKASQSIP
ncbi:MAG: hypothetical protein A2516_10335 [Alphaproteobacteria bacterium RIFOXYD12_FULL_60_8]|nr:MAG: hypothetical protein A2516_10335 [Alphaproteobacteria bacterium RIFOXYD12_FULL_60_8]